MLSDDITTLSSSAIIKITNEWIPKFDGYIRIRISLTVGSNNCPKIGAYGNKLEYSVSNSNHYPMLIGKSVGSKMNGYTDFYGAIGIADALDNYTGNAVTSNADIICHVNRGYPVFLYLKNSTVNGASVNIKINSAVICGSVKEI